MFLINFVISFICITIYVQSAILKGSK